MNLESKGAPRKLVNIERSLPPNLRALHPNEHEVRQKYQEVYMDDQDTPGQTQT